VKKLPESLGRSLINKSAPVVFLILSPAWRLNSSVLENMSARRNIATLWYFWRKFGNSYYILPSRMKSAEQQVHRAEDTKSVAFAIFIRPSLANGCEEQQSTHGIAFPI